MTTSSPDPDPTTPVSAQGPDAGDPHPEVVEIVASGELDVTRSELSSALTAALDDGASRIVVNLLDVSFIDSSVLRDLLLAHREVVARHGWIRLVYTNHLISRVIKVTGLEHMLPQYASVAGAHAGRTVREDPAKAGESGGS